MKRIFSNLKEGKPSLGILVKGSPLNMASLGKSGFDFVFIDMMFSLLGWSELHHNILTARQAGMTPMVRIDGFPWGGAEPDRRLVVHAAHAFSLGAGGVCAAVCSAKEVAQITRVLEDWHRAGTIVTTLEELKERESSIRANSGIIPIIESREALDDIENIMDVSGVTAVFIACTDLARAVGHPFDPEHPDVWKIIEKVVKAGGKKNVAIMANTTFSFANVESNVQRIKRLYDHGVRIIMMQTDYFLLYWAGKCVLDGFYKLLD